jgi:hypothetical protein
VQTLLGYRAALGSRKHAMRCSLAIDQRLKPSSPGYNCQGTAESEGRGPSFLPSLGLSAGGSTHLFHRKLSWRFSRRPGSVQRGDGKAKGANMAGEQRLAAAGGSK